MNVFRFWADPIEWFVHTFTWWLSAPMWVVVLNLLFWPTWFGYVFIRDWRNG